METNTTILKKCNRFFSTKKLTITGYDKYPFISVLLMFFAFSFVGWLWEAIFIFSQTGKLVNRGVLYGPWLPIYGTGGLLFVLVINRFRKSPLKAFTLGMVLCGTIEYATSWYLETFLYSSWWDYSSSLIHLNGRICLEGLLFFGAGGCLMLYFFVPHFHKKLLKIPKIGKIAICIGLIVLFVSDFAFSQGNPNMGQGITM